jgi:peptidylprolyl isomerase
MSKIIKGQEVTFRCVSSLVDGTLLDDPEDNEPLTMRAGFKNDNQFADSIGKALVGMVAGKSKKVTLKPEDAFGEVDEDLIVKVPIEQLPDGSLVGDVVFAETEDGEEEALVVKLGKKMATLDFNHPLAGKDIVLEIEIISVV